MEKIAIQDLEIYITDFKYNYIPQNKKKEERIQRIVIFGIKDKIKFLDADKTQEFYIDSTFKIIPPQYRPYKLLVIAGLPIQQKNPFLLCFILIKYLDIEAYDKLLSYLNENFNFKPKIIMTDFEKALSSAIKKNKITKDTTIHIKCLFHFSQMISKKLSKAGMFKKKLNKISLEILRNIELLAFINKDKIKKFQDIIIKNLKQYKKLKKLKKFTKYLKNYIFKLNSNSYNYEKIIK